MGQLSETVRYQMEREAHLPAEARLAHWTGRLESARHWVAECELVVGALQLEVDRIARAAPTVPGTSPGAA